MIMSFKCRETEKIFRRISSRKIPSDIQKVAVRKLWMIDAASEIETLKIPPANRLELLKGKRKGQYSIRINDKWRICFKWSNGNALDLEIIDYH